MRRRGALADHTAQAAPPGIGVQAEALMRAPRATQLQLGLACTQYTPLTLIPESSAAQTSAENSCSDSLFNAKCAVAAKYEDSSKSASSVPHQLLGTWV